VDIEKRLALSLTFFLYLKTFLFSLLKQGIAKDKINIVNVPKGIHSETKIKFKRIKDFECSNRLVSELEEGICVWLNLDM